MDLVTAAIEQRSGAFIAIGGTIRTSEKMNKTFLHHQRLLTEVVARAQTSGDIRNDINAIDVRLLRYYEGVGLVAPARTPAG